MMNFKTILIASLSVFILSACSFHSGSISTSTVPANSSYEDIVIGVGQSAQLFGLGGTSKDALIFEAKKQLYNSRPLGSNEMYVNFTVDFKRTVIFFYTQTKVTVTADIIESHDTPPDSIYSETYQKKIDQGLLITDLFQVGDSVLDANDNKAVIISIENPKTVRIAYQTKKGQLKTKKVSINKIYTNLAAHNGLKSGDQFNYTGSKGIVLYVGLKKFLYLDESGKIYPCYYERENE